MASTHKARNKAKEILEKYVQKNQNQTDVYKIAEKLGIEVSSADFSEEISGVLDLSGDQARIFVNSGHDEYRQRFSIAHEIGHFLLHKADGIHVDKQTFYRNKRHDEPLHDIEIEANYFAAELLMPEEKVRHLIEKLSKKPGFSLDRNDVFEKLCKEFMVSSLALSIRLQTLGYSF